MSDIPSTADRAARPADPLILVADDDPDDRLLIGDAFERAGIAVDLRFVEDGEMLTEYLAVAGDGAARPDLIVLDLNMPRKDGWGALLELRAIADYDNIPVVILTTSSSEDDAARSRHLGADEYIMKPATFRELTELVRGLDERFLR